MTESARDVGGRTLIAGVGNMFLSDDGFGVEVARQLSRHELPAHVQVADIGVRGVDLAYRLLDGYEVCILVDACARGGEPGTLYRIDASGASDTSGGSGAAAGPGAAARAVGFDGHRMTPDAVLALLGTLSAGTGARPPGRIEVVGCEPADVEEGMGLSAAVAAAVPEAVRLVLRMIGETGQAGGADGIDHEHEHEHEYDHDRTGNGEDRTRPSRHHTSGSAGHAPAPVQTGAHR